jgi:2-dehydro-3-deoxygluconokinase
MVCFDGNFRAKLWAAWDSDPPAILRGLFAQADIAFADHRDIGLVLGMSFEADDPHTRFASAAGAAFAAFPHLQRIACTTRAQSSVDHHRLGALMANRDGQLHACPPIELAAIIDRIGAGDAFAAGVLHGVLSGMDDADSLAFGLASGVLKHYLPGDACTLGVDEVMALVNGERLDVRR